MAILTTPPRAKEINDHFLISESKQKLTSYKSKKLFQQPEDFSPTKRQYSLTDSPSRVNIGIKAGKDGVSFATSLKRKERSWDDDSAPSAGVVREVHVIPPTPRKKKPRCEPVASVVRTNPLLLVVQSFGSLLDLEIVEHTRNPIQRLQGMISRPLKGDMYKLPSGQVVPVIQQPIQEKPTCGPGCVLMVALTSMENLIHSDDFWSWYGGTRLANSQSLVNAFDLLSIEAKICRLASINLDQDDSIDLKLLEPKNAVLAVKEAIHQTGNPVILAITHPILKGHWIIVDGFDNGRALIRDPYTGMAFALPEEILSKWLLEKDPVQDMIYFPASS